LSIEPKYIWIVLGKLHDLVLGFLPLLSHCRLEEFGLSGKNGFVDLELLHFIAFADDDLEDTRLRTVARVNQIEASLRLISNLRESLLLANKSFILR
jgi:hypothetical protein